jgi:pimeloyl-ACP methyl ester carboxylesterase
MTQDVVDLVVSRAGPPPVVLVGHSMGAAVGVAAAARLVDADAVAGVVAEDPPWPLPPITRPDRVRARAYVAAQNADLALGFEGRIARKRRETPSWAESELDPLSRAVDQTDMTLLRTGDIVPPTPWPELLTELAAAGVPVLVVTGEREVRVTVASQAEAERRGASVVRIPGAGHCVRRDQPEAFHAAVDPVLRSWLRAGASAAR